MQEILADCRRLFGLTPRRFSILDWAYLNYDPPPWVNEDVDPASLSEIMADHAWAFRDQQLVRRTGSIVWGAVVQANTSLFKPGTTDTAALVLYSDDAYFDDHPGELRDYATRLFELKGTVPDERALRPLVAAMTAENRSICHMELPPSFYKGRKTIATFLFVARQHLPEGHLITGLCPILVAPEYSRTALVLPAAYWPDDFLAYWVCRDPEALRPSARRGVLEIAERECGE